uniref:Uncharacterized protein n=1 Tax=Ascaris lumbricoides TaxID=6252 RepID=A0A0M3I4T1_ASCLU
MDVAKDEQTNGQESIYGITNNDYDFIAPVGSEAMSDWSGMNGWIQDATVADTVSAGVIAKAPMASLSRLNSIIEAYERRMQGVPFYGTTTNQKEYCWKRPIATTKRNTHFFKNASMTDEMVSPTASTLEVVRPLREGTHPGTLPREGNVKERNTHFFKNASMTDEMVSPTASTLEVVRPLREGTHPGTLPREGNVKERYQRSIFPALMFNSFWEFFGAKEVHRRIRFKAADHFGLGGNLLPSTMASTSSSPQKKITRAMVTELGG